MKGKADGGEKESEGKMRALRGVTECGVSLLGT